MISRQYIINIQYILLKWYCKSRCKNIWHFTQWLSRELHWNIWKKHFVIWTYVLFDLFLFRVSWRKIFPADTDFSLTVISDQSMSLIIPWMSHLIQTRILGQVSYHYWDRVFVELSWLVLPHFCFLKIILPYEGPAKSSVTMSFVFFMYDTSFKR